MALPQPHSTRLTKPETPVIRENGGVSDVLFFKLQLISLVVCLVLCRWCVVWKAAVRCIYLVLGVMSVAVVGSFIGPALGRSYEIPAIIGINS